MKLIFDPAKSEKNAIERDLPFERAYDFQWDTAVYARDDRNDYGEHRFYALGYLGCRLHVIVFTAAGIDIRIISLRKANAREVRSYEQEKTIDRH